MDWLQVWVLALVQGFTEFLPISSSAHLLLVPVFTHWPDQGIMFDVALHAGSLIAVCIYFRRDIAILFCAWWDSVFKRCHSGESRLAWALILGTIPVGLCGLLINHYFPGGIRSSVITAWGLIGFGLLLSWADWRYSVKARASKTLEPGNNEYQLSTKQVIGVALAQALALIPGTSRSGITMTAGLMLGLTRSASARFSFLLSIPVIVLAAGLESVDYLSEPHTLAWGPLVAGVVISAVSAYACIHFFLATIARIGMQPFVVYRVLLGGYLLYMFSY